MLYIDPAIQKERDWQTLLRQEGWTRWPTEVPSKPYHSVILWQRVCLKFHSPAPPDRESDIWRVPACPCFLWVGQEIRKLKYANYTVQQNSSWTLVRTWGLSKIPWDFCRPWDMIFFLLLRHIFRHLGNHEWRLVWYVPLSRKALKWLCMIAMTYKSECSSQKFWISTLIVYVVPSLG